MAASTEIPRAYPGTAAETLFLPFRTKLVQIECKRPMNHGTVEDNIEAAIEQISNSKGQPLGITALDVSKRIARPGSYLEASSLDSAINYLTDEVEKILSPIRYKYTHGRLLGFLAFASIPVVATARAMILKSDGTPYEIENLRTTAVAWVIAANPTTSLGNILRELQTAFLESTHDIPPMALAMR